MKAILKYIKIWRINHAIEIYKVMKGTFPDLQDETKPDISDKEVEILEDEEDGDDWMRILDESFNDVSLTSVRMRASMSKKILHVHLLIQTFWTML